MNRLSQVVLAVSIMLCVSTVNAQQTLVVDFFGESTFRGVYNNVERDLRPTPTAASNPSLSTQPDADALVSPFPNAFNVPRRVVERLQADLARTVKRGNFAVSSTTTDQIIYGGYGQPSISVQGGKSEAGVFVLNTGINDAAASRSVSETRGKIRTILDRAIRTGHKVVMIQPNYVNSSLYYSNRLNVTFDGGADPDLGTGTTVNTFQSYLASLGNDFTGNVTYVDISSDVSAAPAFGGDNVHPSATKYEQVAQLLYANIKPTLTDTLDERKVAQDYVLFFNRAVELGGAQYWLGELKRYGEAYVTQAMFNIAPEYQGLTPAQTVKKWYNNLFRQDPDQSSTDYWVARINAEGAGAAAVAMLDIVRKYGYNSGDINEGTGEATTEAQAAHKKLLIHRTNVGIAYGFRLKRSAVDTSGMMGTITTDPASVFAAMQFK